MSQSLFPTEAEVERLLVGPNSVTWQFTSDARLNLVMLYPLLLQVAHPTVEAGVSDYSDFEQRPLERLLRTADYLNLLVYGGQDAAPAGRRLRALHTAFRGVRKDGERYSALEPDAYAWVHATLIAGYVDGHAHFGRPMSRDQVERFYREYRGLGRLIGVRERDLPRSWKAFRTYFDRVVETDLTRTEATDRVLRAVRYATPAPVPMPGALWRVARIPTAQMVWLGGAGLLSPGLRKRLGIRWTPLDEVAFRGLGAATRSCGPVLPESLRITGPAHLRRRREAIAGGPLGEQASGRAVRRTVNGC
jgi:uncharacterized protein (DUF2236 family)